MWLSIFDVIDPMEYKQIDTINNKTHSEQYNLLTQNITKINAKKCECSKWNNINSNDDAI